MSMIQIEHNNRLYRDYYDYPEITYKSGRRFSPPDFLYKYYPLNDNSIDAITNHYLYASKPSQLNDRFDCSNQLLQSQSYTDEIELLKICGSDQDLSLEEYYLLNDFGLSTDIYEKIFSETGIISMTTNHSDILMWSHYAKNNGFCVEYRIDCFPWDWIGPFPIQYCKRRESTPVDASQFSLIPLLLCFQKNSKWKYEKEWRVLVSLKDNPNRKCVYSLETITGIYFGASFFNEKETQLDPNEEFHTIVKIDNRLDDYRIKLLDFIVNNSIPAYFDFTANIDEITFLRSYCKGGNGEYDIYNEIGEIY